MNIFTKVVSFLFGGSSGGKSIAEEAVDVVDNYAPGEVTKHKMAVETAQVARQQPNGSSEKRGAVAVPVILRGEVIGVQHGLPRSRQVQKSRGEIDWGRHIPVEPPGATAGAASICACGEEHGVNKGEAGAERDDQKNAEDHRMGSGEGV